MNSPLSRWQKEFGQMWEKTSLLMRVVIGAVIGFIIFKSAENFLLLPAEAERDALRVKVKQTPLDPNHEQNLQFLHFRINQARVQVEELRQSVGKETVALHPSGVAPLLGKLHAILNAHKITIVKESNVKQETKTESAVMSPEELNWRRMHGTAPQAIAEIQTSSANVIPMMPPPVLPASMESNVYTLFVYGSFASIHGFLTELDALPGVFFVNNLRTSRVNAKVPNPEGQETPAIGLEFTLYIPYLRENGGN